MVAHEESSIIFVGVLAAGSILNSVKTFAEDTFTANKPNRSPKTTNLFPFPSFRLTFSDA